MSDDIPIQIAWAHSGAPVPGGETQYNAPKDMTLGQLMGAVQGWYDLEDVTTDSSFTLIRQGKDAGTRLDPSLTVESTLKAGDTIYILLNQNISRLEIVHNWFPSAYGTYHPYTRQYYLVDKTKTVLEVLRGLFGPGMNPQYGQWRYSSNLSSSLAYEEVASKYEQQGILAWNMVTADHMAYGGP